MVHVAAWQVTDTTGAHNKYYRAYVAGSRVVFQYGRIGTTQATQVSDAAHPAAAIKSATSKLSAKLNDRNKNYVVDGTTLLLDVPIAAWTDARMRGHQLAAAYETSEAARRHLAGSLSDGKAHVVALVGTDRYARSDRLAVPGRASATDPTADVTLAVLSATDAAATDRSTQPRAALLDLGAAETGDTAELLAAALRLWTPESAGAPQSHLQVCLENARMIFAPARG